MRENFTTNSESEHLLVLHQVRQDDWQDIEDISKLIYPKKDA